MPYEPHTERLAADEQCDLPPTARGVSVERDGDEYLVHYLAPPEDCREAAREEIRTTARELHPSTSTSDP